MYLVYLLSGIAFLGESFPPAVAVYAFHLNAVGMLRWASGFTVLCTVSGLGQLGLAQSEMSKCPNQASKS